MPRRILANRERNSWAQSSIGFVSWLSCRRVQSLILPGTRCGIQMFHEQRCNRDTNSLAERHFRDTLCVLIAPRTSSCSICLQNRMISKQESVLFRSQSFWNLYLALISFLSFSPCHFSFFPFFSFFRVTSFHCCRLLTGFFSLSCLLSSFEFFPIVSFFPPFPRIVHWIFRNARRLCLARPLSTCSSRCVMTVLTTWPKWWSSWGPSCSKHPKSKDGHSTLRKYERYSIATRTRNTETTNRGTKEGFEEVEEGERKEKRRETNESFGQEGPVEEMRDTATLLTSTLHYLCTAFFALFTATALSAFKIPHCPQRKWSTLLFFFLQLQGQLSALKLHGSHLKWSASSTNSSSNVEWFGPAILMTLMEAFAVSLSVHALSPRCFLFVLCAFPFLFAELWTIAIPQRGSILGCVAIREWTAVSQSESERMIDGIVLLSFRASTCRSPRSLIELFFQEVVSDAHAPALPLLREKQVALS